MMAVVLVKFNGAVVGGLDQKDGMLKQMNALSNMGLLSKFVGMLTDSKSFMSFPRHEYFRRLLCNLFGEEIEKGELPNDIVWVGKIIKDICFYNAQNYFNLQAQTSKIINPNEIALIIAVLKMLFTLK
jgi:glucuronate isomerase